LLAQIAFEKGTDASPVTPPTDWELVVRTDELSDIGQAIYYKVAVLADESATSYEWDFGQEVKAAGGILRYTGVNLVPDPIVDSDGDSGSSGSLVAPGINALENSLLVAFFSLKKASTTLSIPAGMTSRYFFENPQDVSIGATDELMAADGATGDRTSTTGDEDKWVAQLVALRGDAIQLPVELSSFAAYSHGTTLRLEWRTESETANAGFEIESRRRETDTFTRLGFVEGRGTTTHPQSYSFVVERSEPGVHVFRLKQIDLDGSYTYSREVEAALTVPGTHFVTAAYPNPFHVRTSLSLAVSESQHLRTELYDAAGRRVSLLYDGYASADTPTRINVEASTLTPGMYFLRTTGVNFTHVEKIMRVE
ncbi:MAG TPA: T9SS type A sorting domain-containing protein, partial [Rhodothermales bacterium]